MSPSLSLGLTVVVFVATYFGLALGKIPGLRIDRTGIALSGAAAVLASNLLSFDDATKAVDFATIILLLGMMIVVEFLRRSDFFEILTDRALSQIKTPRGLLAIVMVLSGVLSALLVNDVVCLALTPLVLNIAKQLRFNPKPHLIGLALASNVGSTATLTGNPQNMIIGGLSGISYLRFAAKLTPIALIGLVIAYFIVLLLCRSTLRVATNREQSSAESESKVPTGIHPKKKSLLTKSLLITAIAISLFFVGAPMEIVAISAASLLLLDRVRPEKIFHRVDWGLLVMFAGLFVVVHAFEVHVMEPAHIENWTIFQSSPVVFLSFASATLSNIVSNVPAVLLFKEIILNMSKEVQETAWLALAMSSTLAGNFTVLGSVANLIVVENAHRAGVGISLVDYCLVGIPVTVLTLLVGVAWLSWVPY